MLSCRMAHGSEHHAMSIVDVSFITCNEGNRDPMVCIYIRLVDPIYRGETCEFVVSLSGL
jgi:hypothetical protein